MSAKQNKPTFLATFNNGANPFRQQLIYFAVFALGGLSYQLYDSHVWWSRAIMVSFIITVSLSFPPKRQVKK